jgi:4-hydroxy-tetrahydrodipicolinate synthase
MSIFEGSGVAIITPFKIDENGNNVIDYDRLEKLIEFQIANKTDAIIICGTTGESSTLSFEEHDECIKRCIDIVNNRVPVIAGTGANNTLEAVRLSKKAEENGADGLLIVTPYYNKTNQDGLKCHYGQIADSVNIPIIMYNVPSRTGVNIMPETAADIANTHSNVVAIKEASGNLSQVATLASLDALDIYSGNDDQIVPILSLGGKGVISVLANVFPEETHNMVRSYLDGNVTEARKIQLESLKVIRALFSDVNPIPVKKAMQEMGMDTGILRSPLVELNEEKTKKLMYEINSYKEKR